MEQKEKEEPTQPTEETQEPKEFDILEFLKGREISDLDPITRWIITQEMLDEWREYRERKHRRNHPQQNYTLEDLTKALTEAVSKAVKEALPQPKDEKMPAWATELQQQQQEILSRLSKEEQAKREQELIQRAQEPIKAEIEKERIKQEAAISELKTSIETLQKLIQDLKPKEKETNPLKQVKEILSDVTETAEKIGYTKQQPTGAYLTPQGFYQIPIKGEVPASWVIIPSLVESVLNSIEKRASHFLGLTKPQAEGELIKLPPEPKIETSPITLQKPAEIIRIPVETPEQAEKPPETPPEAKAEKPSQPPSEAKAVPEKLYTCICGATFKTSIEKARHVKKCEKAKAEKEEKQKNEPKTS